MNLFIDTNVYLTFFHYSDDDLEELSKLIVAIKNKKITLYVTQQVIQEFNRNREEKIAEALKLWTNNPLPNKFPQLCRENTTLYSKLSDAVKSYKEAQKLVIEETKEKTVNHGFRADLIINELFEVSKTINTSLPLYTKAKLRMDLGNPPGKDNSYGDAVNWETLKKEVPNKEDLFFITEDKDYLSPLKSLGFSHFLSQEWRKEKDSEIKFFAKISDFFNEYYPNVHLARELDKDLTIEDLLHSGTFRHTHDCISKLSLSIEDFTDSQAIAILEAFIQNDQVYLIINDDDVKTFYESVESKYGRIIPEYVLEPYNLTKAMYLRSDDTAE